VAFAAGTKDHSSRLAALPGSQLFPARRCPRLTAHPFAAALGVGIMPRFFQEPVLKEPRDHGGGRGSTTAAVAARRRPWQHDGGRGSTTAAARRSTTAAAWQHDGNGRGSTTAAARRSALPPGLNPAAGVRRSRAGVNASG